MKQALIKCAILLALFAAIVGAGCAIGWTIYLKEWIALTGVIILTLFAVPTWLWLKDKLYEY